MTRAWRTRFPAGRLQRVVVKEPTTPQSQREQSIFHGVASAIESMSDNDHSFVVVMVDSAIPTRSFEDLWPVMVQELAARPDDWDVIQTGPAFPSAITEDTVLEALAPIPCSRVFLALESSMEHSMLIFSRSVLKFARFWLDEAKKPGADVLAPELYFTMNGDEQNAHLKQHGWSSKFVHEPFRVWVPRESITINRPWSNQMAERDKIDGLRKSALLLKGAADALLPSFRGPAPPSFGTQCVPIPNATKRASGGK